MNTVLIAIASIFCSVSAQISLKFGMTSAAVRETLSEPLTLKSALSVLFHPLVCGGFVLYTIAAVTWLAVLANWDVSKAYPLVGVGFVVTVLVGYLGGEQVSVMRVVGVGLICAGVILVGRS